MMEAVGRRKAHWLFGAGSEEAFSGKRRPQEDMVTSAVFGSIRLMSPEDRREALKVVLGCDAFDTSNFALGHDILIELWPQLRGLEGRQHVEPDVLLKSGGRTAIVEVKWHAPLSERQLEQQIEAVGAENVSAVIMLGEAGVGERILDTPCFRRTWRDVSGELQQRQGETDGPLGRWITTMKMFLQATDMGRIFNGLPPYNDQPPLTSVRQVFYSFSTPGHPPWMDVPPASIEPVKYTYGEIP